MTELEFYRLLAPLVARLNCGHTFVMLSPAFISNLANNGSFFPYGLTYIDGHAYIYQNYGANTEIPLGTEVLTINQMSMTSIMDTLLAGISSDGYNVTMKLLRIKNHFPRFYYYLVDSPEHFELNCLIPGEQSARVFEVDSLPIQQFYNSYQQQNPTGEYLSYQLIEGINTAVITIRSFSMVNSPNFRTFFRTHFSDMIDQQVETLIIDVRGNSGGDPEFSTELIAYLIGEPFVYFSHGIGYRQLFRPMAPHDIQFTGNVYILIDGGCFSTTGHFCSLMQYHNLATFIGEETGGSFSCNDNSITITLTHSRLQANIARTTFVTAVEGYTRGRGIMPDHVITPSLEDLINGFDRVMDYTTTLIENNNP
jgi:hypothetical protein